MKSAISKKRPGRSGRRASPGRPAGPTVAPSGSCAAVASVAAAAAARARRPRRRSASSRPAARPGSAVSAGGLAGAGGGGAAAAARRAEACERAELRRRRRSESRWSCTSRLDGVVLASARPCRARPAGGSRVVAVLAPAPRSPRAAPARHLRLELDRPASSSFVASVRFGDDHESQKARSAAAASGDDEQDRVRFIALTPGQECRRPCGSSCRSARRSSRGRLAPAACGVGRPRSRRRAPSARRREVAARIVGVDGDARRTRRSTSKLETRRPAARRPRRTRRPRSAGVAPTLGAADPDPGHTVDVLAGRPTKLGDRLLARARNR